MEKFKDNRKELVLELVEMGIKDKRVLDAIFKTPRHYFVREENLAKAYGNYPLPIGEDQTISQPYTVAFMLEALELNKTDKVLEIGTGSGYNAAVLSLLVKQVYTIEIIPSLIKFTKDNLKKSKIKNVQVVSGDGSKGLKEFALYDKIIVTAGCKKIPQPLINQLKDPGILIAPVGESTYEQEMVKLKKEGGKIKKEYLGCFAFVPLTGEYS